MHHDVAPTQKIKRALEQICALVGQTASKISGEIITKAAEAVEAAECWGGGGLGGFRLTRLIWRSKGSSRLMIYHRLAQNATQIRGRIKGVPR